MDQAILANTFTRLSKLKSLTIIFQNIKTFQLLSVVALMNSLKNVANTLTDLSLLRWTDEIIPTTDFTKVINDVIRDLTALKSLEVSGIGIASDLYSYLKDNGIFYTNHTLHFVKTLPVSDPFINIKKLKMLECSITDNELYTIANSFKHLLLLQINSRQGTDNGVVALSKMNNLQYVLIDGLTNITDSSVKLLKNLITLGLPCSNKVTDDSVLTVLENSPNMNALAVYGVNVTAKLVKKAAAILEKREKRLVLYVLYMPDLQQYESPYLELRFYQKLNGKTMIHIGTSAYAKAQIS
ncbi:uncharacterized protein LOC122853172 [Aphidius gifuensis]|uniref:uncharacterized protein LOC122853172 n=1 Tax=Aphidius gifuensis TaxID=684658 RepID=UPI001CDCA003|nr:uncharacterized protein LOC122853172 [Aphidius gifuensis]